MAKDVFRLELWPPAATRSPDLQNGGRHCTRHKVHTLDRMWTRGQATRVLDHCVTTTTPKVRLKRHREVHCAWPFSCIRCQFTDAIRMESGGVWGRAVHPADLASALQGGFLPMTAVVVALHGREHERVAASPILEPGFVSAPLVLELHSWLHSGSARRMYA